MTPSASRALQMIAGVATAALTLVVLPRVWCGRDADGWYDGSPALERALAMELVGFEAEDTETRAAGSSRYAGEWALVTHQMVALGLAQLCMSHPEWRAEFAPVARTAALRSFLPEMRDFGTEAWGEDALSPEVLAGPHGHAYLAYSALAIGMSLLVSDEPLPADVQADYDALIAAYIRRLDASGTGLIDTYPGEAYPTDVAAVAGSIAVHGRVTRTWHRATLTRWADGVRESQIDPGSGLVFQRLDARTGKAHDAPRASGTGLAAYFAGFADRSISRDLTSGILRQERTFLGFGGIHEYAPGHDGPGDVDSGPVILGVSVSATGFALAPFRANGHRAQFMRIYRTTDLFGLPDTIGWGDPGGRFRFRTGGPIGNALLFAFLTSGPEVAP
ncbi:MAG: hypothetical protein EXR69_10655 [Myxococcales bacterium]|nr:hypothetical protein [Myxococcales bacterium]